MKTETEIRRQINLLVDEMYEIQESKPTDLFTHTHHTRKLMDNYKELKCIYWLLDEPLPENIKSLRSY